MFDTKNKYEKRMNILQYFPEKFEINVSWKTESEIQTQYYWLEFWFLSRQTFCVIDV